MYNFPVLIGDIGGTNARFAIVLDAHSGKMEFEQARVADFGSLEEAIQTCVLDKTAVLPRTMVLAVATPVHAGNSFRMTNANYDINPAAILEYFNLEELVLMNDFAGQALAAIALPESDLHPVGLGKAEVGLVETGQEVISGGSKVVLGPGTGLGVANLIKAREIWAVLPGEGGHIDCGPRDEREFEIWPHLDRIDGRVSAEKILCGKGIRNLYQAILKADGKKLEHDVTESWITQAALEASDKTAVECCELFVSILGRIAGDLALITLASGGVYIAGGIAAKMAPLFDKEHFRAAFEDKAPHREIMQSIPVNIMTHKTAALEGLASYAQKPDFYILDQAIRTFKRN